jgi:uncharacterized hydrophobic protein (TIGR00341 family)
MKVIEVIADAGHEDTVRSIAEQHNVIDCWIGPPQEDGRLAMRLLVQPAVRQAVLDALQNVLSSSETARLLVTPVDVSLPKIVEDEEDSKARKKAASYLSREELFNQVSKNAVLDRNYLWLVCLSTIVVAIGLLTDNVAVVIGAMVIAPLLGPNIALALGSALGDTGLMWQSLKTGVIGLGLALLLTILLGMLWPFEKTSVELMSRTHVGLEAMMLALASGAAAVISLASGQAGALVGVMVAVALLPPTATMGLMLGKAEYPLALGAGLLLAMNVASINLSAKFGFLLMGVKPRTWIEQRKASQSFSLSVIMWVVTLLVLVVAVYFYSRNPVLA